MEGEHHICWVGVVRVKHLIGTLYLGDRYPSEVEVEAYLMQCTVA